MLKNLRIIMKTRFYGIPPKGCPRICQPKRSRMPHAGHILLMIYSFYNIKAAGEISGKSLYQIKHCYYYCNYPIRKTECSKHGENRLKRSLGHSRGQWRFAEHQVLAETFPLDQENRNFVRQVPGCLFSRTVPTPLRQDVRLAGVSDGAVADVLDLHPAIVKDEGFTRMVTGRLSAHSPVPLSHRYGGHQFGVWAGQLGDGRAHMLGEYVNSRGERWELQLKGSGLTPYSRRGDGYAVIRSSVREFLASEAMHYLGIPTSRAATLAVSSDPVWRDMFYNGNLKKEKAAVVLRLARSWFRIGSLEILAANQEYHLLRQLTEFIIKEYFSEAYISGENKILAFYSEVVSNTADMIAQWMSVGFAHGVCNTDNFSLLSITIDYGPFRFMDEYEPGMVPNTSDDEHRYSYEKQPDVGHFNLNKLRLALAPLLNHDQQIQMKHILNGYADIYKRKFMEIFRKKLGICSTSNDDEQLIALLLKMMSDKKADFTMTFRQLGDLTLGQIKHVKIPVELWAVHSISNHKWFKNWLAMYDSILDQCSHISDEERRYNMHKINPRYILRNWIAQAVIEKTEAGDFSLLQETLRILENPFSEQQTAELLGFADPPPTWASGLRVSCSS